MESPQTVTQLAAIVGPLVGVIIGGVITFIASSIQFKRQESASRRREHLARLESIHKALTAVDQGIVGMSGQTLMYALAGKDFDSEQMKAGLQFNELRMLVDFYASELSPDVDAIGERFREVGVAAAQAVTRKTPTEKQAVALKGTQSAQAARETIDAMKKRLNSMAREYVEKAV
jgi:hypothetical protein